MNSMVFCDVMPRNSDKTDVSELQFSFTFSIVWYSREHDVSKIGRKQIQFPKRRVL
jgi:hypothetical protein